LRRVLLFLSTFAILLSAPLATRAQLPADAAATVNGQPISKAMLDRAILRFPKEQQEKARVEILEHLIENAIVDQYVLALKISVEEKDVEAALEEIKKDLAKSGPNQTMEKMLDTLKLTAAEFRGEITAHLRWDKFATQQATDAALKALFAKNPDMFDGSQVRARHILLPAADEKAEKAAQAELMAIRKQIEAKVAESMAKVPAAADALTREQERVRQTDYVFADVAKEKSTCPSKRDGGDLNWFPRAGSMVEPFAQAAFALKPGEMSTPIKTQFGYHLILCTGRRTGQAVKFEDVKEEVREIYCNRLHDAVIAQERPKAKIVIAK
jgi:parvulin-like peptidyl-prolyl isomerase